MPHANQQSQLDRALEAFDLIVSQRGWGEGPLLLRTRGGLDPDGGAELAVRPLDGHPAQALLGFSAPLGWTAIGVSAEGWARHYEGEPTGYSAMSVRGASRQRVRILHLLDRDGTAAGRLCWQDGRVHDEAPGDGLVVDCLRRTLGLPTPPPTISSDRLFATLWLEAIVSSGRRGSRSMTWHHAASLHPAMQLLAQDEHGPEADDLVTTALALGRVCHWARVREQAIRGWNVGADASLAEWMDAGMLSRWLIEQHPPLDELTARARRRCTPATMRRVLQVLVELGVTVAPAEAGPGDRSGAA